jgi:hypothetical protein
MPPREDGKRATTVAQMIEKLKCMGTSEGEQRGLAFQPNPSDVIISPYAKSGTTWLQQMVHSLRTRGGMDFTEITEVVPWLEMAHDLGLHLAESQKWTPRAYKSHLPWPLVPKGAKYIYAFRDPKDVVISFYHFFEDFFFERGAFSIREFAEDFFLQREPPMRYWYHIASWWAQKDNPDVLLLSFEEMKANLPETIRRVAAFIDIELDDELYEITLQNSSYKFMKEHETHFNESLTLAYMEQNCENPAGGSSTKVRAGQTAAHKQELPEDISAQMDAIWEKEIAEPLGLDSYQALWDKIKY